MRGYLIPEPKTFTIKTRNTGNSIMLDEQDFQTLKHTQIVEDDINNRILTGLGVPIEKYLGIDGVRKKTAFKHDYRRCNYD